MRAGSHGGEGGGSGPKRRLTAEEREARLRAMKEDAEVRDETQWEALKRHREKEAEAAEEEKQRAAKGTGTFLGCVARPCR